MSVVKEIEGAGFPVYFTGEAIRNLILKRKGSMPSLEIITQATPTDLKDIFGKRIMYSENGVSIIDGLEISSFRKEVAIMESGKIHVEYTSSLKEELARRDFSIDTLAINSEGKIASGNFAMFDMKNRFIDLVERKRVAENPYLILKGCRMAAELGFTLSYAAKKAFEDNANKTVDIPVVKKYGELLKVLSMTNPAKFFIHMNSCGALIYMMPQLVKTTGFGQTKANSFNLWKHSLNTCNLISKKYPLLRLAGLLHDIGKPVVLNYAINTKDDKQPLTFKGHSDISSAMAYGLMKKIGFSKKEMDYVATLIFLQGTIVNGKKSAEALKKKLKGVPYQDYLRLKLAEERARTTKKAPTLKISLMKTCLKYFQDEKAVLSVNDLAINGEDVKKVLSIPAGKVVGDYLTKLFEIVAEYPELNNKEMLCHILERESKSWFDKERG